MTKIAIKNENITPFGGIFHVMGLFSRLGLGKRIDSALGTRGLNGKAYPYSDIILCFTAIYVVAIASNISIPYCLSLPNVQIPIFLAQILLGVDCERIGYKEQNLQMR